MDIDHEIARIVSAALTAGMPRDHVVASLLGAAFGALLPIEGDLVGEAVFLKAMIRMRQTRQFAAAT